MSTTSRRAAIAPALVTAGCVLGLGGPAAPIPVDDYLRSDVYMQRYGYDVMKSPNTSTPASFERIRRVYVTGTGPRVIVLHELPGLRAADVELGAELGRMFTVYVPLLFGVAGQEDTTLGTKQACNSGLFNCNAANTRHSILKELLDMTNAICRGKDVACGVIGMCLTGSFPLWLIHADNVKALVLAQPTLPIFHFWPFVRLDISAEDTASAVKIATDRKASIFMTRSRHDDISGHEAFTLLAGRIAPAKRALSFFEATEIPGHTHSTLVRDDKHAVAAEAQFHTLVRALNAGLQSSK